MRLKGLLQTLLGITILALPMIAQAAALWDSGNSHESVGDVANNITKSLVGVSGLISAICYIVGMGFALSGLMKFKAHKDSPQQMPLSHPITDLAIAFALIFLPLLAHMAGSTAFDQAAEHVNPKGQEETGRPVYVEKHAPERVAPPSQRRQVYPQQHSPYQNR